MKNVNNRILVDIFGSCVSRYTFSDGAIDCRGCADERIKINYFFDKHSILSCMTPAPNDEIINSETISQISMDELWDKTNHELRTLKQELSKSCMRIMKNSNADYFIFDLFGLHTNLLLYKETMFSPYRYEFFGTNLYKKNKDKFSGLFFPFDIPIGLWYGYIVEFMNEVVKHYGENIILVRFKACSHYVSYQKEVKPIPPEFLAPYMANYKFNDKLNQLEDLIIKEFKPHVIDYSKYYIGDQNHNPSLQGAHFSIGFYTESFKTIKEILFDKPKTQQIFDTLSYIGVRDILRIELDNEEYGKMFELICNPLYKNSIFKPLNVLSTLSNNEIVENRLFLSNIYEICGHVAKYLDNDLFTDDEKSYLFMYELNQLLSEDINQIQTDILNKMKQINKLEITGEVESVFEKFLILFENSHLCWIDYLKKASEFAPYDKTIAEYMLNYAYAVEDKELIEKYEKILSLAE